MNDDELLALAEKAGPCITQEGPGWYDGPPCGQCNGCRGHATIKQLIQEKQAAIEVEETLRKVIDNLSGEAYAQEKRAEKAEARLAEASSLIVEYPLWHEHPTNSAEGAWRGCDHCDGDNQGVPHEDKCPMGNFLAGGEEE